MNLFNQMHGEQVGNDRLEFVEDANGDYFIHAGIKQAEAFKHLLPLFNQLQEVPTIDFKIYEI